MNKRLTHILAVGTLSTALVVGGAASAHASTYYVPGTDISVTAKQTAKRTYVVSIRGGVFGAGQTVTIRIPKLSNIRFGDLAAEGGTTWTTTTNAEGGIDPFEIELPEEAEGTFTLTAESDDATSVSSTFSASGTEVTTVAATDSGVDGATAGLLVGGAAIVLAGGALVIGRSRRQQHGA